MIDSLRAETQQQARGLPRATAFDAAVILLVLLSVLAMMPALTRFPPLNNDEGREANLSWVASGLEPSAERMNAYRGSNTWGTGGLQGATTVVLFHLFGLGLFQARLTSLLWGGPLLLVVYWLGRRYWGRAVGLAATVLLAVSDPFLLGTHTLRPDIQAATLVLFALLLVEHSLERGRPWPALLAGILLGLSFDTHMNTAGLASIVAAALLVRQGVNALRGPTIRLLAAGLALSGVYYAVVRILPDPSAYFTALSYWIGIDKAPPLLRQGGGGGIFGAFELEFLRYADYFGLSREGLEEPGEVALVLFGLASGAWRALRGSAPDRTLLLGLLATEAFFVVAVSTKSDYYMLLTYPLFALLIARGLQQMATSAARSPFVAGLSNRRSFDRLNGLHWRPRLRGTNGLTGQFARTPGSQPGQLVARVALAVLVVLAALGPLKFHDRAWDKYVRAVRYREGQEHYELVSRLDELAGPEARILAPPRYWFGLHNHPYTDIFVYGRVRRQFGESPGQFLEAVRPDFVITDGKIGTEIAIERELHRALSERATFQFITRHKNYGDIGIYRLKW